MKLSQIQLILYEHLKSNENKCYVPYINYLATTYQYLTNKLWKSTFDTPIYRNEELKLKSSLAALVTHLIFRN